MTEPPDQPDDPTQEYDVLDEPDPDTGLVHGPDEPGDDEPYKPGPAADGQPLLQEQLDELAAMEGDPESNPNWEADHPNPRTTPTEPWPADG